MKKLLLAALPIALALPASQAFGRTFVIPGTVCQPIPSSAGCIDYTQFGVHNTCGSTATVECPMASSYVGSPSVYQAYFVAYDRNTSTNVSCTLQRSDYTGAVLYSATLSTSGSSASAMIRTFFPNVPQSAFWRMRCTIPAVQSGQVSHITNLLLGTTE
jgi:hypothetical protein